MNKEELLEKIEEKFIGIGQDPMVHLEGLLHSKTMTEVQTSLYTCDGDSCKCAIF